MKLIIALVSTIVANAEVEAEHCPTLPYAECVRQQAAAELYGIITDTSPPSVVCKPPATS